MLVGLDRVAAPIILGRRRLAADVVTGTEAAARGAQQHDAGRFFVVGVGERIEQLAHQLRADRVELVRPVQSDDADLVVELAEDHRFGHDHLLILRRVGL